jgi:hypothetical protein
MDHTYAFSIKGVLRHLTWSVAREYFRSRSLLQDLPCLHKDGAEKGDLDLLCEAIRHLSLTQQTDLEQDFQDIYALANEDAMQLLYDEAAFNGENLTEVLTNLAGPHDAAVWTLVHREHRFADMLRFQASDSLNRRYWRRRYGIPPLVPDTSSAAVQRLSKELTAYLLRKEGRGRHCFVEWLRRSTGYLFIAYPEDFAETTLEYEEDELVRRKIRPARDLLFFYSPERRMLEIFSKGDKNKIRDLQMIFASIILGITLTPDSEAEIAYSLNLLKDESYFFLIDPMSPLESIEVRWVHLRNRNGGKSVTLEVDGPPGRGVIHSAESYWSVREDESTDRYPFSMMEVDRARLQAFFKPTVTRRRGKTKTFTLNQYGTVLDQEGPDGIIRKALVDSGLERAAPDLVPA